MTQMKDERKMELGRYLKSSIQIEINMQKNRKTNLRLRHIVILFYSNVSLKGIGISKVQVYTYKLRI
jgi:hypothetical protein